MSGDVQPRKRKDKKRKRDDSDSKAADLLARKLSLIDDDEPKEKSTAGVHATKMGPDDIQLHVQSDHGTGGHWCAKILFFSLMAVLAGLIGLILLENRGLADLDTPLSESRFADYLEGWVDEKRESHDDHDVLESLHELDDHNHDNEPFAEESDHDDADDDHDEDNDTNLDADHEDGEEDDDGDNDSGQDEDQDDAANGENDDEHASRGDQSEEDNNDDEGDDDNNEENSVENEESQNEVNSDEHDNDDDKDDDNGENSQENEQSQNANEADDNDGNDDDDDSLEENNEKSDDNDEGKNDDNEIDDDDNLEENHFKSDDNDDEDEGFEEQLNDDNTGDDDNSPFEEHVPKASGEVTVEPDVTTEELKLQVDELYESFNKLSESLDMFTDDIRLKDDDFNSDEEVIDNDKGEDLHLQKREAAENENDKDEQSEESSSLTVKLGVGLALVVVAHLVLVKRSRSNEEELIEASQIESNNLKRRLTLITPSETIPSDVDDEQPNDDEEDEYDEDDLNDDVENVDEKVNLGNEHYDEYEMGDVECSEEENEQEDEEEEVEEEEVEEVEEEEEEEEEAENGEQVPVEIDAFTEMKNMYVPRNDTQQIVNEEKPEVKTVLKTNENAPVQHSEEEYESDEDLEDEEEEEDDEEEDVSDVDDDDLMKRLESKYGKLPESHDCDDEESGNDKWTKVKHGGPQNNDDDFEEELRRANAMLDDNPTSALQSFEFLIEIKPNSSEAWYGKGRSLDILSEQRKSNEILNQAIAAYVKAVEFGSLLDDEIFKRYAENCISRMRFIGQHLKAVPIHNALIERFTDDPHYRNQLALSYLLVNRLSDAKLILHETLLRWRQDGFALVHYGFVLKNLDKNYEAAVVFLQEGIDSNAEGTNTGLFYFNLGEALNRLGRNNEAMAVYRKGAAKRLFLSAYQRSLYNVDRLISRPFWSTKETGYERFFDILEQNWQKIRDEGLSVLNHKGYFTDESEDLRDVGAWKQFDLFARGRKVVKHCEKTPFTCKIIETIPAARFCSRGQVKFSVMHPGTHVWPHCGPTNCRIRAHLGLQVPEKTFIRVATETRSWKEGKMLIFDDSFEHEVWHNGTSVRLVLIVDVWHPDLTEEERTTLTPI